MNNVPQEDKLPQRHQVNLNAEERDLLDEKFGSNDKKSRTTAIKNFLLASLTPGTETEEKPLKQQYLEQQVLHLKLKNQILLVHDLKFPIAKTIDVIAKPEIYDAPKLSDPLNEPAKKTQLDKNNYCEDCKHTHYGHGTLGNCSHCNCGVRLN